MWNLGLLLIINVDRTKILSAKLMLFLVLKQQVYRTEID